MRTLILSILLILGTAQSYAMESGYFSMGLSHPDSDVQPTSFGQNIHIHDVQSQYPILLISNQNSLIYISDAEFRTLLSILTGANSELLFTSVDTDVYEVQLSDPMILFLIHNVIGSTEITIESINLADRLYEEALNTGVSILVEVVIEKFRHICSQRHEITSRPKRRLNCILNRRTHNSQFNIEISEIPTEIIFEIVENPSGSIEIIEIKEVDEEKENTSSSCSILSQGKKKNKSHDIKIYKKNYVHKKSKRGQSSSEECTIFDSDITCVILDKLIYDEDDIIIEYNGQIIQSNDPNYIVYICVIHPGSSFLIHRNHPVAFELRDLFFKKYPKITSFDHFLKALSLFIHKHIEELIEITIQHSSYSREAVCRHFASYVELLFPLIASQYFREPMNIFTLKGHLLDKYGFLLPKGHHSWTMISMIEEGEEVYWFYDSGNKGILKITASELSKLKMKYIKSGRLVNGSPLAEGKFYFPYVKASLSVVSSPTRFYDKSTQSKKKDVIKVRFENSIKGPREATVIKIDLKPEDQKEKEKK